MSIAPVIRIRAKVPTWTHAERLRKVRRETGLKTEAMAELLGVNASRYSAWETGRNPIPDILGLSETIEEQFGYSKYWFRGDLDGEGYTPGPEGNSNEELRSGNLRAPGELISLVRPEVLAA